MLIWFLIISVNGIQPWDVDSTYKSLRAVNDSGWTIQSNNMTPIDTNLLPPTTAGNAKLLSNLHEISLVLDGKSDMHSLMGKNRDFLNYLKFTTSNTSIPQMRSDLRQLKTVLVDQQVNERAQVAGDVNYFWKTQMQDRLFVNYTNKIEQQIRDAIKSVSTPLRQIEVYINTSKSPFRSDSFFDSSAPLIEQKIANLSNKLEFVKERINRLINVEEAGRLSAVSDELQTLIASGKQKISSQLAGDESKAEDDIHSVLDQTVGFLNVDLTNIRDTLLGMLSASVGTNYQLVVDQMIMDAQNNENNTQQLADLQESINSRVQLVRDAKAPILASITPLVAGLGVKSNQLLTNTKNAIDSTNANLNQTTNDLKNQLNTFSNSSVANFTNSINQLYFQIGNTTQTSVANLAVEIQAIATELNATLQRRATAVAPATARMAEIAQEAINITTNLITTASDYISAKQTFVEKTISTNFENFDTSFTNQVQAVYNQTDLGNSAYAELASKVSTQLSAQLADFIAAYNESLNTLRDLRSERIQKFNDAVSPYSSVYDRYNETLISQKSFLAELQKNLTKMDESLLALKQNQSDQVANLFTILNGATFEFTNNFSSQFADAKSTGDVELQSVIKAGITDPTEIDDISKFVKTQFADLQTILDSAQSNVTVSTNQYQVLKQTVDSLLEDLRSRELALESERDRLAFEYSQNITHDNSVTDLNLQAQLAKIRANWTELIVQKIDSNSGPSTLNKLLGDVSPDLVYSSDNSDYTRAITATQTAIDSIDEVLRTVGDNIREQLAAANKLNSIAFATVTGALSNLIDSTNKQVSPQRVLNFHNDTSAAIAQSVNVNKGQIFDRLANQFTVTKNALMDYLSYMQNFESSTIDSNLLQTKQVAMAHIQLGHISTHFDSMLAKSRLALNEQEAKNLAIKQKLFRLSNNLKNSFSKNIQTDNILEESLKTRSIAIEGQFTHNLTKMVLFVHSALEALNNATDAQTGQHLLNAQANEYRLHRSKKVQEIANQLSTDLTNMQNPEKLAESVQSLQTLLTNEMHQLHTDVFVPFWANETRDQKFEANVQRENKLKYMQMLNVLTTIVSTLGMEIPELVGAESRNRKTLLRTYVDKLISELDKKHSTHYYDDRYDDQITVRIQQKLNDTRTNLKKQVHSILAKDPFFEKEKAIIQKWRKKRHRH